MFYVYIYRDPSRRNEPIYVGKGQGKRVYVHLKRTDHHPFTYRLAKMKRAGIEPHIEIIHCNNEEVAFAAEVLSIKALGRKDLGKGTLLNLSDGGEGGPSGCIRSVETRQRMSEAQKGKSHSLESRKKQSLAQSGKNHSQYGTSRSRETRQKLSSLNIGKVHPKTICPHCGILTGPSRHHFDKCKAKKEA